MNYDYNFLYYLKTSMWLRIYLWDGKEDRKYLSSRIRKWFMRSSSYVSFFFSYFYLI